MGLFSIGMKKLPTRLSANQMIFSTLHLNMVPTQPFQLTGDRQDLAESRWKHSEGNCGKGLGLQLTNRDSDCNIGKWSKSECSEIRGMCLAANATLTNRNTIYPIHSPNPRRQENSSYIQIVIWVPGVLTLVVTFRFSSTLISPFCVLSPTSLRHTYLAQICFLALSQLHIKTHSQNRI